MIIIKEPGEILRSDHGQLPVTPLFPVQNSRDIAQENYFPKFSIYGRN